MTHSAFISIVNKQNVTVRVITVTSSTKERALKGAAIAASKGNVQAYINRGYSISIA